MTLTDDTMQQEQFGFGLTDSQLIAVWGLVGLTLLAIWWWNRRHGG